MSLSLSHCWKFLYIFSLILLNASTRCTKFYPLYLLKYYINFFTFKKKIFSVHLNVACFFFFLYYFHFNILPHHKIVILSLSFYKFFFPSYFTLFCVPSPPANFLPIQFFFQLSLSITVYYLACLFSHRVLNIKPLRTVVL